MTLLEDVGDRWYEVPLLLGAVLADVQGTQRGDGLRRGIGPHGREIQRPCKFVWRMSECGKATELIAFNFSC